MDSAQPKRLRHFVVSLERHAAAEPLAQFDFHAESADGFILLLDYMSFSGNLRMRINEEGYGE